MALSRKAAASGVAIVTASAVAAAGIVLSTSGTASAATTPDHPFPTHVTYQQYDSWK